MRTIIYKKGGVPRSMRAPECIAKVIEGHKCKIIAEIGIHACGFCDQLLGLVDIMDEYYMIDPWPHGYKCGSCGGEKMTPEKWDNYHALAVKRTIGNPVLKVIRMTSVEASKLFADNYFDLVFIDADHTKKSVTEDIGVWLPKIKEGGVICGHDYSGGWQPVVDAVDQFFLKRAGSEGESLKKFYQINDKHYRMDSGVWVVEL
jgi:hypothetical protein